MKYYLIAGEASGDLHGANLISNIKKYDTEAKFRFFGGDLMAAQAGTPTRHYRQMAFMGIFEVLTHLSEIKENFKICKTDLIDFQPDVLILIDYPGFNLKMAKFAKQHNIKTVYYISPKIWIWKKNRVKQIKQYIDKMFVIFPFETNFYKQYNYEVEYVGNPIVDALEAKTGELKSKADFVSAYNLSSKPIIALLAGSRKQEISKMIPMMLDMASNFLDFEFVVAGAPGVDESFYTQLMGQTNARLIFDQTYQILSIAHVAVVNSGTATLETALLGTPQVVCYKMAGGKFLYNFGYHFYGIRFTSLVNILLQRECVKELIQHLLTKESLLAEMKLLIYDNDYRNKMLSDFNEIKQMLGPKGSSERAAKQMVLFTKQ